MNTTTKLSLAAILASLLLSVTVIGQAQAAKKMATACAAQPSGCYSVRQVPIAGLLLFGTASQMPGSPECVATLKSVETAPESA
jgi:hypothetical protein